MNRQFAPHKNRDRIPRRRLLPSSGKIRFEILLCLASVCLTVATGCANQNINGYSTEMTTDVCIDNPLYVPQGDPCQVWETTVDVVSRYFERFNREQPVRQIGGVLTKGRLVSYPQESPTLLEPWRSDAGDMQNRLENSLQTMRHWADIHVVPAEQETGPDGILGQVRGFWISVRIYEELEQASSSSHQTAGGDTFRYEQSIERVADPIGEVEIHEGWSPMGRNTMLEQKILTQLFEQLSQRTMRSQSPTVRSQSPTADGKSSGEEIDPPPLDSAKSPAVSDSIIIRGQSPAVIEDRAIIDDRLFLDAQFQQGDDISSDACSNGTPRSEATLNDRFVASSTHWDDYYSGPTFEDSGERFSTVRKFYADVRLDYSHFYSCDFFWRAGFGLSIAAVLANTSMDNNFNAWHDQHVRTSSTDDFSRQIRWFGNGYIVFPAMAGIAFLGSSLTKRWKKLDATRYGHWATESATGPFIRHGTILLTDWSLRFLRGAAVGVPTLIFFQYVLGASRPLEKDYGSKWRPGADSNSASGHAFIGGLLFITAAKMTKRPLLKACFYGLSILPAWSRINDGKHYLSQVFLGWWFAHMAASAVDRTENFKERQWFVMPTVSNDTVGIDLIARW